MPIGSTNVYNAGDLILSTVSGSGTSFTETKIIAATSSLIYFDSNARINSASLNAVTVGTSSYVSSTSNAYIQGGNSFGQHSSLGLNDNYRLDLEVNNSTVLSLTGSSVGIGTTDPGAALDVSRLEYPSLGGVLVNFSAGTTSPTTEKYVILRQTYTGASHDSPMLVFRANANASNQNSYGTIRTISNGSIIFSNVNATTGSVNIATEKVRIQADGNVGIGTTTANNKLHVYGINDANVSIESGNGYNAGILFYDDASLKWTLSKTGSYDLGFYNNSLNKTILTLTNTSGNVGIGTNNPHAKLEITGSSTDSLFNINSPISGNIIYVTGSGCVGINKSTPTATFDISGSSIITGSLNVSANITCLSLTETSTETVKYNIIPLTNQLDNILKLKPVSFNYKINDKHSIGLIAEEVAKIYPEFTSETNDSISYGKITSVLIQSIKELKNIIDIQQKQIEDLSNKLKQF